MVSKATEKRREVLLLMSELSRTVRCCQQEAVLCESVTFSQFFILDTVAEQEKLKLGELHRILSVDKSTTTRLINPLVKQGLMVREKSDDDSRAVNLRLTREGKELHREVWECLAGFVDSIHMGIPEEKRADVYEAIRIFLSALQEARAAREYGA